MQANRRGFLGHIAALGLGLAALPAKAAAAGGFIAEGIKERWHGGQGWYGAWVMKARGEPGEQEFLLPQRLTPLPCDCECTEDAYVNHAKGCPLYIYWLGGHPVWDREKTYLVGSGPMVFYFDREHGRWTFECWGKYAEKYGRDSSNWRIKADGPATFSERAAYRAAATEAAKCSCGHLYPRYFYSHCPRCKTATAA